MLAKARHEASGFSPEDGVSWVLQKGTIARFGGFLSVITVSACLSLFFTGTLVAVDYLPLIWSIPVYGMVGAILTLGLAALSSMAMADDTSLTFSEEDDA